VKLGQVIKKGSGDKKEISKAWAKFLSPNSKYDLPLGGIPINLSTRVLGAWLS
jgi:hypothetical protein